LRGYGDVDESVARHLDPRLHRLHAALGALGQLLAIRRIS